MCYQVNDFLSGKAPLNLTMRLGDHMMLIQLQLSTVSSSGSSKRLQTAASTVASTSAAAALNTSTVAPEPPAQATATAATACSAGNIIGTPRLIPGVDAYPITRVRNVSDDSDDNSMDTTEDVSPPPPPPSPPVVSTTSAEPLTSAPAASAAPVGPCLTGPCSCDASTSTATATTTTAAAAGDKPQLDTRALAEASRNLTQTLKQLSSEVLTTKSGSKEVSFEYFGYRVRLNDACIMYVYTYIHIRHTYYILCEHRKGREIWCGMTAASV